MVTRLTPSFAVVIIWQFTQAWNEFLFAVILTNQAHWSVTVALNNLAGSQLVQGMLRWLPFYWRRYLPSWYIYSWGAILCVVYWPAS